MTNISIETILFADFPSLHPIKSTFLVGLTIAVAMFILTCRGVSFFAHRVLNEEFPLNLKVFMSSYLSLSLYSSTCVSTWVDVPAFQRAINIWMRLSVIFFLTQPRIYVSMFSLVDYQIFVQDLHFELTNTRPKKRWLRAEKFTIIWTLIVPVAGMIMLMDALPEIQLTYEYIVPFGFLSQIVFPLSVLYIGFCSYIAVYAKEVNQKIKQV